MTELHPSHGMASEKLKQPAALRILFLTEMWERFGFYIVQAMMVLYFTQKLGWTDSQSYAISGAFTAFVYLAPILGGYIADHILGYRVAIIIGGIFLIIGYGLFATLSQSLLYVALTFIIIGNGFFKPNIATLLSTFYQEGDPRLESAFTIFYMGINIGSMMATLFSGFVKEWFGWSAGFALASFGLVLGMIGFFLGAKKLAQYRFVAPLHRLPNSLNWLHNKTTVLVGVIIAIPLLMALVQYKTVANTLFFVAAAILLIVLFLLAKRLPDQKQRQRMKALIWLCIISVVFWAIWFQIFFSLNLFIERNVNRFLFGMQIPTIAFISFEAIFIVITAPLFAGLWVRLAANNRNPSIPMKFFLAFILTAIAFLILKISTLFANQDGLVNAFWIPVAYLFITLGEMCLSPILIAAVTLLSPQKWKGMMMGIYLIGIGYGGKLAGLVADLSSIPEDIKNRALTTQYYGHAFLYYAILAAVTGIIVLLLVPLLKQWIGQRSDVIATR